MRSHAIKLSTMKRSQSWIRRDTASSLLPTQFIQSFCDEFVELRRGRASFGTHRLFSGFATIGQHSVLVLLHWRNGRRGKSGIFESAQESMDGYCKIEQKMQLAHKFNRPVVVCYAGSTSASGAVFAEPHEARGFPRHVISQWYIEVPVILLVLNRRSAYGIFVTWLADTVFALDRTQFVMPLSDPKQTRCPLVGAGKLFSHGIIDNIIPASLNRARHSQVGMSYRLRNALIRVLEELPHVSPRELMFRRRARLARVEAVAVKLYSQGK